MKRCCQVGVELKGSQTFGRTTIGQNYKSLHSQSAKSNFILKENSSWGPSKGNKYFKKEIDKMPINLAPKIVDPTDQTTTYYKSIEDEQF